MARRICACVVTASRRAPSPTPASTDGTRRRRTAVFASRRYAHRAIASPMRSRVSMTPVDSFAGSTRANSAAATEASPGTAVFASPVRAAAAMRATQVRVVSVDRSMSIPCRLGSEKYAEPPQWERTSRAACCVPRRCRAARVETNESLPPPYDSRGKLRNRAKLLTDPAVCPSRSRARCVRTRAEERSSDPARPQPGSSPCSRAQRGRRRAR